MQRNRMSIIFVVVAFLAIFAAALIHAEPLSIDVNSWFATKTTALDTANSIYSTKTGSTIYTGNSFSMASANFVAVVCESTITSGTVTFDVLVSPDSTAWYDTDWIMKDQSARMDSLLHSASAESCLLLTGQPNYVKVKATMSGTANAAAKTYSVKE